MSGLETATAHMTAGQPGQALRALAPLLAQAPEEAAPYKAAVDALAAAVMTPDGFAGFETAETRDALHDALILQKNCPERPHILARKLAELQTSGNVATATALMAELHPALSRCLALQTPPLMAALCVLAARGILPDSAPDAASLSALHLQCFPQFAPEDLALLYCTQFNADLFGANRDDLLRNPAPFDMDALGLVHRLTIDWLGGGPLFQAPDNADLLASLRQRLGNGSTPAEQAAARALILRYWRPGSLLTPNILTEELGLGAEILEIAHNRTHAPQASPAPPAEADGPMPRGRHVLGNLAQSRLGLSVPGRRKPRIALCVSGQLRGFRAAFATWQRNLLPLAEFDIYVHSWAKTGRAPPQPFRAVLPFEGDAFCVAWRRLAQQEGYETMQARYPALFAALDEDAEVDAQTVRDAYGARDVCIEDDQGPDFHGFSNPDKMHYKIWAAHELAMASGRDYDLVLRLRPDLPLGLVGASLGGLAATCRTHRVLYVDGGQGVQFSHPMIGDQVALAHPDTMQIYAHTWHSYKPVAATGVYGMPEALTGHVSLAQSCWLNGVHVRKLPIARGGLVDAAPLAMQHIQSALEQDTAARMDAVDTALRDAITRDLSGGR